MVADPNHKPEPERLAENVFRCIGCGAAIEVPPSIQALAPEKIAMGGKTLRRSFICGPCLDGGDRG